MKSKDNSSALVDKKYKWYLFDLGFLIKQRAIEAKEQRKQFRKDSEEYDFHSGRILAFNEVITLMQQQAQAFQIGLEEIRVDDIVPDSDLV